MRRPVMYLAGMLLVTGASFAFAGTANATVSHSGHAAAVADRPDGDEYDLRYLYDDRDTDIDYDRSLSYSDDDEDNRHTQQASLINFQSPTGDNNKGSFLCGIIGAC